MNVVTEPALRAEIEEHDEHSTTPGSALPGHVRFGNFMPTGLFHRCHCTLWKRPITTGLCPNQLETISAPERAVASSSSDATQALHGLPAGRKGRWAHRGVAPPGRLNRITGTRQLLTAPADVVDRTLRRMEDARSYAERR